MCTAKTIDTLFSTLTKKEINFVLEEIQAIEKKKETLSFTGNQIIYLAEFNKNSKDKCKISIFKETTCTLGLTIPVIDYINPVSDWFYDSKLWFKKSNCDIGYEAFVSYIDDYREKFTVSLTEPLVSLNVTLN